MWACYVICAFINPERTQMNLEVGPHTVHTLNKCDDTPPGPFPLLAGLLLLNLRGRCCSTNETVSMKTEQDKGGGGKERGRELCKISVPQWFWQEVHFKEMLRVQGIFHESDKRPRLSILRQHTKQLFLMVAYLWLFLILKDGTWCFGWRWWRRAVIGKNRILIDNSCKSRRSHRSLLLYQLPSDIYYIHFIYVHCIHACEQMLRPLWHKEKENRHINPYPTTKTNTKKGFKHDQWPIVHQKREKWTSEKPNNYQ